MGKPINAGRHTAHIEGDFVVFLIGARFNRPSRALQTLRDVGGLRAGMPQMLQYLVSKPEKGLLGYTLGYPTIVQYWRSFEHLEAFATDEDDPHLATWRTFVKRTKNNPRTGVWHETYKVRAGDYEAIYANMPDFGLAKASSRLSVAEGRSARQRLERP